MAKKKVFISYDHSEDALYRRLLQAWDANGSFEFNFDDYSPTVAIDSINAAVIKTVLTKKMKESDYLIVIVGAKTASSSWVNWEIERAQQNDVKLKLAAVKIEAGFTSPSGLLGVGTAWAMSFTLAAITTALDSATNTY
jgi:hypothetical protein